MVKAYFKIKFLELEVILANFKVERISTKILDNVLSSQKSSHGIRLVWAILEKEVLAVNPRRKQGSYQPRMKRNSKK